MTRLSRKKRQAKRVAPPVRGRKAGKPGTPRRPPASSEDLPEDFWEKAIEVDPVSKRAISLRVDEDVLEWFRRRGSRYQSRMNAVLRSYMTYMEHRRRVRRRAK